MENKVFLIATHNMKKRNELYRILSPLGIDVQTADEIVPLPVPVLQKW